MAEHDPQVELIETWLRDEITDLHGNQALQDFTVEAVREEVPDTYLALMRYKMTDHAEILLELPTATASTERERLVREAARELMSRLGLPAVPRSVTDAAREAQVPDPMVTGGGSWSDAESPPTTTTGAGVAPAQGPYGGR